MDVPPSLTRHRRDVEVFLRQLVDRPGAPLLYRMARYHLGWEDAEGRPSEAGGKMVRSGLCLLACEAAGGDWRQAIPAAAAVELVHSFSLVHDDIQDRDRERHHRPAVWTVWGEAQAINAGDALLALARLALAGLAQQGVEHGAVVRASRLLDEATLEMVEGQTLDLEFEARDISGMDTLPLITDYLGMVAKKTGALFACAQGLGAMAAGASDDQVQRFELLGRKFGLMFQFCDDMLGIWGDERKTGKPAGADVRRRKKSLPVIFAMGSARGRILFEVYDKDEVNGSDLQAVLRVMQDAGVRERCQNLINATWMEAQELIEAMELRGEREMELTEVLEFLRTRDF